MIVARGLAALFALFLAIPPSAALARGGRPHGGGHGVSRPPGGGHAVRPASRHPVVVHRPHGHRHRHHGSTVVVHHDHGWWGWPFWIPVPILVGAYDLYPYPAPYPTEVGDEEAEGPPAGAPRDIEDTAPSDPSRADYGLVQLRGVPDGAAVELDGRFWLEARELDDRWLALPWGAHTLTVRIEGRAPLERAVEIEAGKTHVVRFGPGERRS